jgi:hypothetical protein
VLKASYISQQKFFSRILSRWVSPDGVRYRADDSSDSDDSDEDRRRRRGSSNYEVEMDDDECTITIQRMREEDEGPWEAHVDD